MEGEPSQATQSFQDADDSSEEKFFDFFGLPPELRNAIYSKLVEDAELEPRVTGLQVTLKSRIIPKCLRLNRRFKGEHDHEQRLARRESLDFTDFGYGVLETQISDHVRKTITRATLRLVIVCSSSRFGDVISPVGDDARLHATEFEGALGRLASLQNLGIEIYPRCVGSFGTRPFEFVEEVLSTLKEHLKYQGRIEARVFPVVGCPVGGNFGDYDANFPIQETWVREGSSCDGWKLV